MSSSRNDHVCGDSFDYARYPRAPVADVRVSVKPAGTQGLEMAARRG